MSEYSNRTTFCRTCETVLSSGAKVCQCGSTDILAKGGKACTKSDYENLKTYCEQVDLYLFYVGDFFATTGTYPVFGVPMRRCVKCSFGTLQVDQVCHFCQAELKEFPCPFLGNTPSLASFFTVVLTINGENHWIEKKDLLRHLADSWDIQVAALGSGLPNLNK